MHPSSPMIFVAGPDDRAVVTDTTIRYRPAPVRYRRYRVAVTALRSVDRPASPER